MISNTSAGADKTFSDVFSVFNEVNGKWDVWILCKPQFEKTHFLDETYGCYKWHVYSCCWSGGIVVSDKREKNKVNIKPVIKPQPWALAWLLQPWVNPDGRTAECFLVGTLKCLFSLSIIENRCIAQHLRVNNSCFYLFCFNVHVICSQESETQSELNSPQGVCVTKEALGKGRG